MAVGQYPTNRRRKGYARRDQNQSSQAQNNINDLLCDLSYGVWLSQSEYILSHDDWILDTGTTSHICKKSFYQIYAIKKLNNHGDRIQRDTGTRSRDGHRKFHKLTGEEYDTLRHTTHTKCTKIVFWR